MFKKIAIPFLISSALVIITFLLFENLETFFVTTLKDLSVHKTSYSLVSFFVLASDILLPVPSSIVMYTNGYVLGLIPGSVISLIALMVGSVVGYYLGRFTSIGLKAKADEKTEQIMMKYGVMSILVSRGIPIIAESICIVCGYNRMSFKYYFLLNFIGYIPLCLLYSFFGSSGYDKNTFLISFGCSLLLSALFWIAGKKLFGNLLLLQKKRNG